MKDLLEKIKRSIAEEKQNCARLWTPFEEARASYAKSVEGGEIKGTEPEHLQKLDDLLKPYNDAKDRLKQHEDQYEKIAGYALLDGVVSPVSDEQKERIDRANEQKTLASVGERLVGAKQFKELVERAGFSSADVPVGIHSFGKVLSRAELKTLITSGSTSGGAFVVPDRVDPIDLPRRTLTLFDLITVGETDQDVVEWVAKTSRTNAAAETAEAGATGDGSGAAPESAVAWAVQSTNVRDITHFMPVTKRVMANAAQLRSDIDAELGDGARERLETQCLNGNGTAPNLRGILQTSGRLTQALGADTRSDAMHKGITQVLKEFFTPDGIMLTPDDAEQVYLEKDANGLYIYGPPSSPNRGTIWGLRTIVTAGMPASTGLLGAFRRGATLWLREDLTITASDSHDDFFTRRMVAVMAVIQAAFAARYPKAFCELTGF